MLLTVKEVAKLLNASPSKVYNLKGEIHYVRLGGSVRFRQEDVNAYLAAHLCGNVSPHRQPRHSILCH